MLEFGTDPVSAVRSSVSSPKPTERRHRVARGTGHPTHLANPHAVLKVSDEELDKIFVLHIIADKTQTPARSSVFIGDVGLLGVIFPVVLVVPGFFLHRLPVRTSAAATGGEKNCVRKN